MATYDPLRDSHETLMIAAVATLTDEGYVWNQKTTSFSEYLATALTGIGGSTVSNKTMSITQLLAGLVNELDAGPVSHLTSSFDQLLALLGGAGESPVDGVISAGAGTFAFSGDTMTPLVDYRLPVDAGSFAFTGQAATLEADRLISAAAGSFTFTGQAATLTPSASAFSLTLVDSDINNSGTATATFTGALFGADDANRRIVVGFFARMANTATPTVTIGGVSATLVPGTAAVNTNTSASWIFQADVPTGASGNVVVTSAGNIIRSGIGVYRLVTATPTQTDAQQSAAASTASRSNTITIPSGGAGIAIVGSRDATGDPTWTNAVKDFGANLTGGGNASSATISASATVTGTTVGANEMCMSSAAWGP